MTAPDEDTNLSIAGSLLTLHRFTGFQHFKPPLPQQALLFGFQRLVATTEVR